jgi:hypothetical protein
MTLKFNGREVEIELSLHHGEGMIDHAWYIDTLVLLTEGEIDMMEQACAMEIEEHVHQYQVMRAEAYYEGDR